MSAPTSLDEELTDWLSADFPSPEPFDDLAVRLFRWQLEGIEPYRRFCEGRRMGADEVGSWRDIPLLPVAAFKIAELHHASEPVVRRFTTSGTTGRGRSNVRPGVAAFGERDLAAMDDAIVSNARRMLLTRGRCRVLVLAPAPERAPHMIMSYGMQRIVEAFGTAGSCFLVDERGIDRAALTRGIEDARDERVPVCLIGASFGFVGLFDDFDAKGEQLPTLPPGSRVMDAGGYKGRSRELNPEDFRAAVRQRFDVPDHAVVNLLGMTELSSQIYDTVVFERGRGVEKPRRKLPPPWVRTRVVDPEDPRRDVEDGRIGVLAHYDLANRGRPIAILSDDLGRRVADGFEILGRVRASEARGCSIKVDELLIEGAA